MRCLCRHHTVRFDIMHLSCYIFVETFLERIIVKLMLLSMVTDAVFVSTSHCALWYYASLMLHICWNIFGEDYWTLDVVVYGNWCGVCVDITLCALILCISHVTYLLKHFWRGLLCYQVHVPFRQLYGSLLRTISNMLSYVSVGIKSYVEIFRIYTGGPSRDKKWHQQIS
jgi:hypothetical protein